MRIILICGADYTIAGYDLSRLFYEKKDEKKLEKRVDGSTKSAIIYTYSTKHRSKRI